MSKTIKLYCCTGRCRVNNERASKCCAYASRMYSGVRTCGTCVNSRLLSDDGSVPDYLSSAVDDDGIAGVFF